MQFIKSYYHLILAFLGNLLFGFPSRKLFVIGVTGTKGKSTVLELINATLEAAGKRTALLSSVRRKVCAHDAANLSDNTMPGRLAIQGFLKDAVKAKCEFALIEVTSQGVTQHRHRFIDWDAAVFINLAPEHIESHGSFEEYREAKVDFFRYLAKSKKTTKHFFINENDANHHYFEEAARRVPDAKINFFSRDRFIKEELGRHYDLRSQASRRVIGDWLLADFNLENAAAAVAIARTLRVDWPSIQRALDSFRGVPGRLEFVQKQPFSVVIDYAHTPDSLEKVYQALDPVALTPRSGGELICVLGSAGGGRDKWKRSAMGKIAATHCSKIILTNEDPYDEDPMEIIKEVEDGFLEIDHPRLRPDHYFCVLDRKEAIQKAVSIAKKGDVVVITGKGSERWIHVARGKKISWSERCAVEEALKNTSNKSI